MEHAIASCVLLSALFVLNLYLFSPAGQREKAVDSADGQEVELVRYLPRNHPKVIRRRLLSVFCSCALSFYYVHYVALSSSKHSYWTTLQLLGWHTTSWHEMNAVLLCLLHTASFFMGPLLAPLFVNDPEGFLNLEPAFSLVWWRNYIVSPVAEEFVFRACILAILRHSGYSDTFLIFASPLFFGASLLLPVRMISLLAN